MKLPFQTSKPAAALRTPSPACIPQLRGTTVTALYRAARVGGDFFDFAEAHGRLVFVLLDIAGTREGALHIAAIVQDRFRATVPTLFAEGDVNDAIALSNLTIDLNRTIIQAADGVRCAPAFVASFQEEFGTLQYVSAGHPPALVRDHESTVLLEANGLPLGLFSHATHDAQVHVLAPGSALVVPSKGLVEARRNGSEFGIEGVREYLAATATGNARDLCAGLLQQVEQGVRRGYQNDMTVVALVRAATAMAAAG